MEKLSYLATFISLIYGLGVANVLAHLSSLIKRGRNADWYWVHTLWAVFLLVLMATMWWVLQNWSAVPHIGYLSYLSMLLAPSQLFITSDLLFPERQAEGLVDLKAHFFRIKRALFVLLLVGVLADELDSLLKGWDHVLALGPPYWASQVVWYAVCITGFRSDDERTQGVLVCVSLAVLVASMHQILGAVP
jgi:hypothetical protein